MKQLRNVHLALVTTLIAFLFAACSQEPAPQAASIPLPTEFPNEDKGLISPEGQIIIDAVLDGRIPMPKEASKLKFREPQSSTELHPTTHGVVPEAVRHPFEGSMNHFLYHANGKFLHEPATVSWWTNYCTFAPDSGPGYNFKNSCRRHDYGYINWPKYNAASFTNRLMIDRKMLSDMKNYCSSTYSWYNPTRAVCYTAAYTYYGFVRNLGGWFF